MRDVMPMLERQRKRPSERASTRLKPAAIVKDRLERRGVASYQRSLNWRLRAEQEPLPWGNGDGGRTRYPMSYLG